jgi:hypothetical protein
MNHFRVQHLQFNTENQGFPTYLFKISDRFDKRLLSTLCKKISWKISEEMEESVCIKFRLGQTDGSVAGTCWTGRRKQDMMMMIGLNMVI